MNHAFVIAFRDRGTDPRRARNLKYVTAYVESLSLGPIHHVSDGRTGSAQWNRHIAYNTGARLAFNKADVVTFYEADMIVPPDQLTAGINKAAETPHLVVPFTERHEYGEDETLRILAGTPVSECNAKVVMPKPRRTGAINIISRATYELVGQYDPAFAGSHWDDRSMHRAFDLCVGPTEWIDGPAHHLYHLPGHTGRHLTAEDKAATQRNRRRYARYERARTPDQIRHLTAGN